LKELVAYPGQITFKNKQTKELCYQINQACVSSIVHVSIDDSNKISPEDEKVSSGSSEP
jgi:hypothetical protein